MTKATIGILTINDLIDREYEGIPLTTDQRFALLRFHNYRAYYLSLAKNDLEYKERYYEIQAKANLSPYTVFLKKKYNSIKEVQGNQY